MATKRTYRIQVFCGSDGFWRYRLRSPNGQIMQSGESYVTQGNAKRAATRFADLLASPIPTVVEIVSS